MPQPLPNPQIITITVPNYRKFGIKPGEQGPDLMLDSTFVDNVSGHTPTFQIRPGWVVVLSTGSGTYFPANGTTGDRNAPPAVLSTGTGDATWNSATVTTTLDGGVPVVVTLGAGTATAAAAVTNLNANAIFAAQFIADVSGGFVRIRALAGGAGHYISCASSAASFYGAGVTLSGQGTDADYRVLEDFGYVQDINGAAVNCLVMNTIKGGAFITPNLFGLTAEAQAVLQRKGALFFAS